MDASQQGKSPFAIVLTSTMGDFTYTEKAVVQMVTANLLCECITHSFLIDECRITEIFSGYIVNFVKQVWWTSLLATLARISEAAARVCEIPDISERVR
ncbi:hypothetical protein TNCV_535401 [Trichonephila clavipes]|nr:hypothetical protein TNCV_535401 [Trichonephila clavipes]